LSDALVADGASVLRYDKRGIGASKAAMKSEAALRFDEFVDDAKSWADWLRGQNGITCVFMLGHSEGGLVATLVAKQDDLAGLVLLDSPGRPLTAVMREQLSDAPLDKKTRSDALEILNSLEAGQTVADVAPALHALFRPSVQPFLISLINIDPAKRLAALKLPTLIVSGGRDLQVTEADYDALKSARPKADAVRIPDMNHVLKNVVGTDRASNLATYANPDLPLAPALKSAVTDFIRRTDCPTG